MRIVKERSFNQVRLTIFINNEKYSVKFEKSQCEIHYKFRRGEIDNLTHLDNVLTDEFLNEINNDLDQQIYNRNKLLRSSDGNRQDYIPEII